MGLTCALHHAGQPEPACVCVPCAALLAGLVPSVEGDESAGHVAALRAAALGVDEALRADNTMLESCDARDIGDRMRALGQVGNSCCCSG